MPRGPRVFTRLRSSHNAFLTPVRVTPGDRSPTDTSAAEITWAWAPHIASTTSAGAPPGTAADAAAARRAGGGAARPCRYRRRTATTSRRLVDPHRLVSAGRRWYLVGYDLDRADWRIFRVDRISHPRQTGSRATPRELPAADAAEYVTDKLYELARVYQAVATLHAPLGEMRARFGGDSARLEPLDGQTCRLHSHTDTLEWLAFRLATLGCDFEVHEPPELIDYVRGLGERIRRSVPPDR